MFSPTEAHQLCSPVRYGPLPDHETHKHERHRIEQLTQPVTALTWAQWWPSPLQVAVLGRARTLAAAKCTSWAAERAPLEAQKTAGITEVLLADSRGGLLEGLLTNLFVVARDPDATDGSVVILTAPAGDECDGLVRPTPWSDSSRGMAGVMQQVGVSVEGVDRHVQLVGDGPGGVAGVLPGLMRARVLQACRRAGLTVCLGAPGASARGMWQEAFLTNCLRGIQPVGVVESLQGNAWGHEPWSLSLPHPYGPITRMLQQAVEQEFVLTAFPTAAEKRLQI